MNRHNPGPHSHRPSPAEKGTGIGLSTRRLGAAALHGNNEARTTLSRLGALG
jgi:hypothetical protein